MDQYNLYFYERKTKQENKSQALGAAILDSRSQDLVKQFPQQRTQIWRRSIPYQNTYGRNVFFTGILDHEDGKFGHGDFPLPSHIHAKQIVHQFTGKYYEGPQVFKLPYPFFKSINGSDVYAVQVDRTNSVTNCAQHYFFGEKDDFEEEFSLVINQYKDPEKKLKEIERQMAYMKQSKKKNQQKEKFLRTTHADVAKQLAKLALKIGQIASKAIAKSETKKIPVVGFLFGVVYGGIEVVKGNYGRAVAEVSSGAASCFPGPGTAASLAIDGGLLADTLIDLKKSRASLLLEQKLREAEIQERDETLAFLNKSLDFLESLKKEIKAQ